MRLSMASLLTMAIALISTGLDARGQGAAPSATELAAKVQARYDTVRDFTADFTLTLTSSLRPKPKVERGEVKVKKPLKMRFSILTSEKNQTISDGVRIYQVFPQDKYVVVLPVPKPEESSAALLFLAGRGNLTRDFAVSLPPPQPAGVWHLMLKPTGPRKADFQTLTLVVDRTAHQIRGLMIADENGGTSTYQFTNLRENRNLSDREFDYTIPRGYEQR